MYTIVKLLNGSFQCTGRLQDGTERWSEGTLKEAIKSMKSFAKTCNGTKIKKKDITFEEEVMVNPPPPPETIYRRWYPKTEGW